MRMKNSISLSSIMMNLPSPTAVALMLLRLYSQLSVIRVEGAAATTISKIKWAKCSTWDVNQRFSVEGGSIGSTGTIRQRWLIVITLSQLTPLFPIQ